MRRGRIGGPAPAPAAWLVLVMIGAAAIPASAQPAGPAPAAADSTTVAPTPADSLAAGPAPADTTAAGRTPADTITVAPTSADTTATAAPQPAPPPAAAPRPAWPARAGRTARPLVAGPDSLPDFIVLAGDTLWLTAPIEVIGRRAAEALPGTVRPVDILGRADLERLPARSTTEALASAPGVVLGQRQEFGVQSDLSIRGSTFEQVDVLLEGIDISDPQTGHHLLDLPLGRHDVASLEVLRGHGSVLHGGGALGGVVNVIAAWPEPRTGGWLGLSGGQAGLWSAHGSLDLAPGGDHGLRGRVSAGRLRTDGDRPNTDADLWTATARLALGSRASGPGDLLVGYARREFGAQDFYGPTRAWERTETAYAAARWRTDPSDRLSLEPRLFFRYHTDRFLLYRAEPQRYRNDHRTRRGGAELRSLLLLGRGWSAASDLEAVYEDIHSRGVRDGVGVPALGDHLRRRLSAAVQVHRSGRLRWQAGGRVDGRSELGARWSGSTAAYWQATRHLAVRTAGGTVYRAPTFTELRYEGPFNLGDPALEPERSWSWEAGFDAAEGPWVLSWTFFERHERDVIDWVRPVAAPADEPWRARNLEEGLTRGSETTVIWHAPRGHLVGLSLMRLDREVGLPAGEVGKYALVAPTLHAGLEATAVLPAGLELTAVGRYTERTGGGPRHAVSFVADARLGWRRDGWGASLEGTNLLDRRYEEIPGVPMPGTLVSVAVERRI